MERYAAQMRAHPEIPCIQLTPEGIPAREPSRYEGLFTSDPDYPWYACCQGSLWRREALLSLLRKEESAWKFECFGSRRAKYSRMEFLTVDPTLFSREPQYRYSDKTPELRRARQEEYIETVRQLQAVIEDVRTLDDAMQAYDRFLIQNGYVEQVQGWASGTHYRATKKSLDNPVITNKLVQALHTLRIFSHQSALMCADRIEVTKKNNIPLRICLMQVCRTSTKSLLSSMPKST